MLPPPPRNFVFVKKDHKINLFFLSTVGDQEKSCGPSHTVTLSRVSYICLFYIVDFGGIFAPLYDFFRALFHKNNPLRSSSFFMLDPTFKHYHSQILHRGRIIPVWRIWAVLIRIPLFILTFWSGAFGSHPNIPCHMVPNFVSPSFNLISKRRLNFEFQTPRRLNFEFQTPRRLNFEFQTPNTKRI